jgi:hypothetical protein
VADEQVQQPDLQRAQLGQRVDDLARDEMKAARAGVEADLTLQPHH